MFGLAAKCSDTVSDLRLPDFYVVLKAWNGRLKVCDGILNDA